MSQGKPYSAELMMLAERYSALIEAGRSGALSSELADTMTSVISTLSTLDERSVYHVLFLTGKALRSRKSSVSSDPFIFDSILSASLHNDWDFVRSNMEDIRDAISTLVASRNRIIADIQLYVAESRMYYQLSDVDSGISHATMVADSGDAYARHLAQSVIGLWMLRIGDEPAAIEALRRSIEELQASRAPGSRPVLSWIPPQVALYTGVERLGVAAEVRLDFVGALMEIVAGSQWLLWRPSVVVSADHVVHEIRSYHRDIYGEW